MAVRYRPLGQQADDDTQDETRRGSAAPQSHFSLLSPTSPTAMSQSTATTGMVSPLSSLSSPTPSYTALAEQTFTPLSMDGSEYYYQPDGVGKEKQTGRHLDVQKNSTSSSTNTSASTRPRPSTSTGSTAPAGSAPAAAKAPGRARGATLVSSMVQSFEALQAARTGAVTPASRKGFAYGPVSTGSPSSLKISNYVVNGSHRHRALDATTNTSTPSTSSILSTWKPLSLNRPNPNPNPNPHSTASSPKSTTTANTTLVRPTPTPRYALHPLPSLPPPDSEQAPIVRTSSTASLTINHPTPDQNRRSRSGAYLGNIAALEASAERLSMTSSIEDAIRDELNELKRTDSRRSSILRVNSERRTSDSDASSIHTQGQQTHLSIISISRQSSIVGLNTAARLGGYSPGGYIMSPHPSLSGRRRSGSGNGSGTGFGNTETANDRHSVDVGNGEDFPFMPRSGPGKSSTRSTASKLSLAQIVEREHPSALTREALDAADHAANVGEDPDDDDTIRASAYQHIEEQFAGDLGGHSDVLQPMLIGDGFLDQPAPRLQLHQPGEYPQYQNPRDRLQVQGQSRERPTTAVSGVSSDQTQAQSAFGDFDGVHCDPDVSDLASHHEPEALLQPEAPKARPHPNSQLPPQPKSYFDQATGRQMLYYPAPVPAMLNLPPKLSKKPKAAARDMRRSHVLNAMPQVSRESRVWLPDPTEGLRGSQDNLPFMTELLGENLGSMRFAPSNSDQASQVAGSEAVGVDHTAPLGSPHARQHSETSTIQPPQGQQNQREIRRPQRLKESKSHSTIGGQDALPPQLRATAFFELPSAMPKIEVRGGSAMATLDSILDASATAPVSAFTDHAFAGKLGSEVYGRQKKKKPKKSAVDRNTVAMSKSTPDLLQPPPGPKKRASHLSLFGGRRKRSEDMDAEEGRTTLGMVGREDGIQHASNSVHDGADRDRLSPNELAPDADEESDEESEEDEGNGEYQGPPTTLLAELQLRKQQNKQRTRPMTSTYHNGMHSTLLELDTVAEVHRKARLGKRVNLAWEDPGLNPDTENQDDDDVPLGMLYIPKVNSTNRSTMDISAVMSEAHRPLGLMERREIEDNEPLSRRRERLQGRQNGQAAPMGLDAMHARMGQMNISPYGNIGTMGLRASQSRLTLPLHSPAGGSGSLTGGSTPGPEAEEGGGFEGESLAERKARLAAENPLPRARPVSGMFSSELLSQFGGEEDSRPASHDSKGKGKAVNNGDGGGTAPQVPEEEETLGQRRRRLQAEREAREREIGPGPIPRSGTPVGAVNSDLTSTNQLSHRLSMADMLGAHPREAAQGLVDPRMQERARKEHEAARQQQERDNKMAAMRAHMPTSMMKPVVGARNGGYLGGVFNDGVGGTAPVMMAGGRVPPQLQRVGSMGTLAIGSGGGLPAHMHPAAAYGVPVQPGGPGHVDMVERWRREVMP
ncbi:hypothetical protein B0T25DRAFT_463407 [Lasiosphaeria hispida]|uniref:Uncharacterized protein n=1 Tax=Lasiosphaeria hispida TaxID=260671 RepID=A0AAJ0H8J0_9PEZI|nr:hypothetical protein B0T25DRAFT_463407 [Lasiosphaeria hispida]